MARNADPRPGRWILPIIVVGMIGFTYFFVQTLEASDQTTTETSAPTATSPTTTAPGVAPGTTSPTTTQVTGTEDYVQTVLGKQSEADVLGLALSSASSDFDNQATTGIGFTETEAAFLQIQDDTSVFAEIVRAMPGPPAGFPEAAEPHAQMIAAAGRMEQAAADALDGLRAPDTGQLRRAAVEDYLAAVDAFVAAGDAAIAAVGG